MNSDTLISQDDAEASLLKAIKIAFRAHARQTDKTGAPYFLHCKRVADAVDGNELRIVAYLHDVAEKGDGWSLSRLKAEGFGGAILGAVDALTRRDGEADDDFVARAISNDLARPVKIADLRDNLAQAQKAGSDTTKYIRELDAIGALQLVPIP